MTATMTATTAPTYRELAELVKAENGTALLNIIRYILEYEDFDEDNPMLMIDSEGDEWEAVALYYHMVGINGGPYYNAHPYELNAKNYIYRDGKIYEVREDGSMGNIAYTVKREEPAPYNANKKNLTAAEKAAAKKNLAAAESAEKYWREIETRPCYRTKNARERAFRWGSNAYLASVFAYLAIQGQDVELADIKTFCDAGYVY